MKKLGTAMRSRTAIVAVVMAAAAAGPLASPARAYHCYSDVIGDCSVVQHMLEDFKANMCLFLEKATLGVHDC